MKSFRILLVEDNEGDILLTSEAIQESSFAVDLAVAKDGKQALTYMFTTLENNPQELPQLILLDINLPRLNGHEVLRALKTHDQFRHVPVIIFTTSTNSNDIYQCYREYANSYLSKPMDLAEYYQVVHEIEKYWLQSVKLPVQLAS